MSSEVSPSRAPQFIVLDGVNGAGKTTLQKRIADYLSSHDLKVRITREPGGSKIGQAIRSLVLESKKGTLSERAEMFLFAADRAQHVDEIIRPACAAGEVVICDRYFYSSLVFQGYGRGLDVEQIWKINEIAINGCLPDLVFILDLDPKLGLTRNKHQNSSSESKGPDAFEEEDLAFHTRIREGFLNIAKSRSERFVILDASKNPEEVWSEARAVLAKFFGLSA